MISKDLIDKYKHWKENTFNNNKESFEKLATEGQFPEYMFISCVDSRVDPNSIFNAKAGELFVHRNIANLIPSYNHLPEHSGTIAAIEFGVCSLGIKNLIVMGHSSCGGIKNGFHLCSNNNFDDEASAISRWLKILQPAYEKIIGTNDQEKILCLEKLSIINSIENLKKYPFIGEGIENDTLNICGIWNDIGSGEIHSYNEKTKSFEKV